MILDRLDLKNTLEKLKELRVKLVGVQLPDGLKYWTQEIVKKIEKEGYTVIVSGKPSYGSCDLDTSLIEVVDVLLHFAHPPVLKHENVVYVDYSIEYNVPKLVDIVFKYLPESVSLIATSPYVKKLEDVRYELEKKGIDTYIKKGGRTGIDGLVLGCNFKAVDKNAKSILFIGDGSFHPKGAAIYTQKEVYAISPLEGKVRMFGKKDIEKFLKNRYSLIGKAMDSKKFCVAVSSKPGQKRFKLALNIYRKLKKRYCTTLIYFDEFMPENFSCDCFVNTACPRIAYDDWKKFRKPIITPQEVEILLKERDWNDYIMDEIDEIN